MAVGRSALCFLDPSLTVIPYDPLGDACCHRAQFRTYYTMLLILLRYSVIETVNIKVKFTLEQATKAQKWSRDSSIFLNFGARWGWVVNAMPRSLYSRERPGTHCIGGRVGPRAGLDGCGKSRPPPIGIRSPDGPVCSESPYRLSYPSPCHLNSLLSICVR